MISGTSHRLAFGKVTGKVVWHLFGGRFDSLRSSPKVASHSLREGVQTSAKICNVGGGRVKCVTSRKALHYP